MSNEQRAALIATLQSLFPLAVILGVNVTDVQQAAIMLAITNSITLFFLFWKPRNQ